MTIPPPSRCSSATVGHAHKTDRPVQWLVPHNRLRNAHKGALGGGTMVGLTFVVLAVVGFGVVVLALGLTLEKLARR